MNSINGIRYSVNKSIECIHWMDWLNEYSEIHWMYSIEWSHLMNPLHEFIAWIHWMDFVATNSIVHWMNPLKESMGWIPLYSLNGYHYPLNGSHRWLNGIHWMNLTFIEWMYWNTILMTAFEIYCYSLDTSFEIILLHLK